MRESEGESGKLPPCGYGSMGLCCSSCLLGPCRISPFERDSAKGQCGDNADLIVAKNLLRLVVLEGAAGLNDLSERVRKLGSSDATPRTGKVPANRELKGFVEKYGLSTGVSPKRFARYLVEESERLLSPLYEPEKPSTLLSSLYPERAFPYIHRNAFLPNSLTGLVFETLSREQMQSSTVKGILWQCLKTSMLKFISEELCRDMNSLTDRERLPETEGEALDVLKHLPPNPLPIVILFSSDDSPHREFLSQTAQELQQELKGDVLFLHIMDIATLTNIARRLFQKWSLSVAEVGAIALVFSQSPSSVLAALVCGFTVVSFPALPIHGSNVAEDFLSKDLKEKFGSVYTPPQAGEVIPVILKLLREKP